MAWPGVGSCLGYAVRPSPNNVAATSPLKPAEPSPNSGAANSYLVAPHPEDPETRVLACVKTNLAKMPPSLSFRIDTMFHEGAQGDVGFVTWLGAVEMSSTDLLGGDTRATAGAVSRAETFLQQFLAAGAVKSEEVLSAASKKSIGKNSVWEAKKALGVKARKLGYGTESEWHWELPDADQ